MTLPDFPVAFYAVAGFVVLASGISKGGFGMGAVALAVPLMSIFVAPAVAAAIMLPILCAMDLFGVHAYRRRWSTGHLKILLPGALVGIGLGALAFGGLSVNAIRVILGVISIVFAVNQAFGLTQRLAAKLAAERAPPGRAAGAFWGTIAGFTSTLAHSGGPPYWVYMLPQGLDRTTFVATSTVFFLVVNYVKLVPYAMLGQLNLANLSTSLLLAPLAPVGVWLGVWLHRRMSDRLFYRISYAMLFATGVKLLWDALA